ncbi:uncharacterized protein TNCV_1524371 [Trichonephila clavipes]|nr:uncharacterized protein TNCV_1524371 [Trichonephila clavipes]
MASLVLLLLVQKTFEKRTLIRIQGWDSYTRAFRDGPRSFEHGQVTWTTPELAPPLLTTTPTGGRSALGRFNVHHCPTQRVFSGTGLELVTRPATIRYLDHYAFAKLWFRTKADINAVFTNLQMI